LEEALGSNFKDSAFGVSLLAKALFVSEDTLARRIATLFGPDTKPRDVLRRYRLEETKRQLLETDKTVAVIAEECGFREVANFIRMFQEAYGETPGRYRKIQIRLNGLPLISNPPRDIIFSRNS
jgi:AraC-like DNA-binding protein